MEKPQPSPDPADSSVESLAADYLSRKAEGGDLPDRSAYRERHAAGSLDLQEEVVDRIVDPEELEIAPGLTVAMSWTQPSMT